MASDKLKATMQELVKLSETFTKNIKEAKKEIMDAVRLSSGSNKPFSNHSLPKPDTGSNGGGPNVPGPAKPVTNNGGIPGGAIWKPPPVDIKSTNGFNWTPQNAAAMTQFLGNVGGAANIVKNLALAAPHLLPDAEAGVQKQRLKYMSGVAYGSYSGGEAARLELKRGMGGRIFSVNETERVAVMSSRSGILGSNSYGVGAVAGWANQELGIGAEEAVQSHLTMVGSSSFQNNALVMGIQTTDSRGGRMTGEALYDQMYKRWNMGQYRDSKDLNDALMDGRLLGVNLDSMSMDENEKAAMRAYAKNRWEAEQRGEAYSLETGQSQDSSLNPALTEMKEVSAYDEYVDTGSKDAVDGFNMMNEALTKVTKSLNALYKATDPLSGLMQTINGGVFGYNNSIIGGRLSGAAGFLGEAASTAVGMYAMNRMFNKGTSPLDGVMRATTNFLGADPSTGRAGKWGNRATRIPGMRGGMMSAEGRLSAGPGVMADGSVSGTGGDKDKTKKSRKSRLKGGLRGGGALAGAGFFLSDMMAEDNTVFGMGVSKWDEDDSLTDKMNKSAMTVGGRAAQGAMMGMLLGPKGALIGAALGGAWGLVETLFTNSKDEGEGKRTGPLGSSLAFDSARVPGYSSGAWNVPTNQIAKLHQNEMVLSADVAQSLRTAMQEHSATGLSTRGQSSSSPVTVNVTLTNASWAEAKRLVKIVKDELEMDTRVSDLARA